ncbi:MAG: hypothetical protein CL766_05135 [Chloroflexi bacterium]|nr:hypothetical protein [Chloroflexota bacterium]|tara:strand:- start:68501 stop:69529 length:1029 start_codon:yes stop_codon:yes gene_type:complete
MKSLVLKNTGRNFDFDLENHPIPNISKNEILVKVKATGVCFHDISIMLGILNRGVKNNCILGHEIAGEVVQIGDDVNNINLGDNIVSTLNSSCGDCSFCKKGLDYNCDRSRGYGHGINGGFTEYIALNEFNVVIVPSSVNIIDSAILACPIAVSIRGLKYVSKIKPKDKVLITGSGGGLGLHSALVSKYLGANVIALTTSTEKENKIRELTDSEVILLDEFDFSEIVMAMTDDLGVDLVVNTVGSLVFEQSIRSLSKYGEMLVFGEIEGVKASVNLAELIFRNITVNSSCGANKSDILEAIDLVDNGSIKPVVSKVFKLEEANKAFEKIIGKNTLGRVVLIP